MIRLFRQAIQWLYFLWLISVFLSCLLLTFPILLFLLLFPENYRDRLMFHLMRIITPLCLACCGIININVNRSKVRWNTSCIIIPSHQCYLDAALIYLGIPKRFKTLGKIEIAKTPLYGLMYKMVVILVDRTTIQSKALSFRKMKKEMEKGCSLIIFPEGTFADHISTQLSPFQAGAFSLAIMQQVPLQPILYPDAAKRMHPSRWWQCTPGITRTIFLPSISTQGLTKYHTRLLTQYSEDYIQYCYTHYTHQTHTSVWNLANEWLKNNPIQIPDKSSYSEDATV